MHARLCVLHTIRFQCSQPILNRSQGIAPKNTDMWGIWNRKSDTSCKRIGQCTFVPSNLPPDCGGGGERLDFREPVKKGLAIVESVCFSLKKLHYTTGNNTAYLFGVFLLLKAPYLHMGKQELEKHGRWKVRGYQLLVLVEFIMAVPIIAPLRLIQIPYYTELSTDTLQIKAFLENCTNVLSVDSEGEMTNHTYICAVWKKVSYQANVPCFAVCKYTLLCNVISDHH